MKLLSFYIIIVLLIAGVPISGTINAQVPVDSDIDIFVEEEEFEDRYNTRESKDILLCANRNPSHFDKFKTFEKEKKKSRRKEK